jgi:4-hydroxy-tetrahydrodipicolinate synthase
MTIPDLTDGQVAVGAGYECFVIEALALGARAWFSGISNVAPGHCVRIWDAAKAGDFVAAFAGARDLFPSAELIARHGHVRVVAEALDLIGTPVGPPRRPLMALEPADRAEVGRAVAFLSPGFLRHGHAN